MGLTNKIHDAFDHVKADEELKASTIRYLETQRAKRQKKSRRTAYTGALAAACTMLFLLAGIGGYSWLQTPVSYLSIDINPSIELALNRFDRVVAVTAYNEDGENVLKGLSLKGKEYQEAVDAIVKSEALSPYLADESALIFTVASDSSDKESELSAGVNSSCHGIRHHNQSVNADSNIVSEAHDNGLSLGKYYAYLKLHECDSSVTVDDCKDMSMGEIHSQIKEHHQERTREDTQSESQNDNDNSRKHRHRSRHHSKDHE